MSPSSFSPECRTHRKWWAREKADSAYACVVFSYLGSPGGCCSRWPWAERNCLPHCLLHSGSCYHVSLTNKLVILLKWILLNTKHLWFLNHSLLGRESSVSAQTPLNSTHILPLSTPVFQKPCLPTHSLAGTHWGQNCPFPYILTLCHCRYLKAKLLI